MSAIEWFDVLTRTSTSIASGKGANHLVRAGITSVFVTIARRSA